MPRVPWVRRAQECITLTKGPPSPTPPSAPPRCARTAGSGGAGRYRGGDGVIRELEFLRPLTFSILSERRAVSPFGILGGRAAAKGVNLWLKRDGRVVSLGGKATVQVRGHQRSACCTSCSCCQMGFLAGWDNRGAQLRHQFPNPK